MAKILNKINISVFIILAAILLFLIFADSFVHVRNKLTDALYEDRKPITNILIIDIDDASINKIGRWPWDRSVFASILDKIKDAKAIGMDVSFFEKSSNDSSLQEKLANMSNVVLASEINENVLYKPIFNTSTGYVNILTDYDGITRKVNLGLSKEISPFAFEVYQKGWDKNAVPEKEIKLINFANFDMNSISAYRILEEKIDVKNKIVLIGATAPNLHDNYFVPVSQGVAVPGVNIHASIIQNLILKDFLKEEYKMLVALLSIILSLIGMFFISRLKIYYSILSIAVLIIIYALIAILAYSQFNVIMDLFFMPLSLLVFTGAGIGVNYLEEKKHSKFVTGAFGKYVSKDLLNEIINKRQELKLGGVKKEITIFFSDIRGFTNISEKLNPEQLVKLINEYLTEMTKIIMQNGGTVDKFIGDAIMAFWNAPLDEKEHAKLACKSAIEQINALEKIRKSLSKKNMPDIKIGCGINTGEAVIGNMGSEDRFNYTALGDSVNLASRLESLTKQYGVSIIVSESTYNKVKGKFDFRKLDKVKVKGKKIPITIFELCVKNEEDFARQFEKALACYFDRNFAKAKQEFEHALKLKKDDVSCRLFIERCREYSKNKPASDWDGSFEMKTK
jgi:adenylate cyclase